VIVHLSINRNAHSEKLPGEKKAIDKLSIHLRPAS